MQKPVGMLAHPGMIRRRLERNVYGHMQVALPGRRNEPVEGVQPAQIGMHGLVSAGLGADGPGAAGIARLRVRRVVLALPVRMSDGMHGGKVYDVEPEFANARQQLGRVVQRGVGRGAFPAAALPGRGAGKEFVPGGKAGQHGVCVHGVCFALDLRQSGIVGLRKRNRRLVQRGGDVARLHGCGVAQQRLPVLARGALCGSFQKPRAHEQFACDLGVLAFHPARKLISPRRKGIGPGPHPKKPRSQPIQRPRGEVFVVVAQRHRADRLPFVVFVADEEFRGDAFVPFGNQVRPDRHFVAEKPADGPAASVRSRRQPGKHRAGGVFGQVQIVHVGKAQGGLLASDGTGGGFRGFGTPFGHSVISWDYSTSC